MATIRRYNAAIPVYNVHVSVNAMHITLCNADHSSQQRGHSGLQGRPFVSTKWSFRSARPAIRLNKVVIPVNSEAISVRKAANSVRNLSVRHDDLHILDRINQKTLCFGP